MRTLLAGAAAAGLIQLAFIQTTPAQTVLKREPHYLAPGSVVFVDGGRCGVGKVMKVTGISKTTSRRRSCTTLNPQEATLSVFPAL